MAFENRSYYVGVSPISMGLFDRVTAANTGKASQLGTLTPYPLALGATFEIGSDWYLQPRLIYSLVPRKNSTGNLEEKLFGFSAALGSNFSSGSSWDWNLSLGILEKATIGKGGNYTDPNNAAFTYPDSTLLAKLITTGVGIGYESKSFRFGTDAIFFGLTNSKKRSLNLMLTLAWKGKM